MSMSAFLGDYNILQKLVININYIACLLLGSVSTSSASFGQGDGPIHVSNVQCNGNETQLQTCGYSLSNTCTHSSDAGIMCVGKPTIAG